jgi:hypothetical protein
MRSLLWKEWRENLKWAVLPPLVLLGTMALLGAFPLLEKSSLFVVSLCAALFGAGLGFLQVFFESQGDRRSLLLHRPLSSSRIFLGKVIAGVGLYLLALGIPFVCAAALAATPGHVEEPFSWQMTLPWLADGLTGVVYYFAGMLVAQREARWYGSRCLGLAAALGCSYLVWVLPEFGHALLVIVILGGVMAVAAWGSFVAGGAYAPQPRLAKVALAVTFMIGLSTLSFTGKALLGGWLGREAHYVYVLDQQGRVMVVQMGNGRIRSVTDLEGEVPQELQGKWLDHHVLGLFQGLGEGADYNGGPRTRSYRSRGRFFLEFLNHTKPGHQAWWYVPDRGLLLGYDHDSKQFVGSYGPDGFCPPDAEPHGRFQGELLSGASVFYAAWADDYLAFADRVYAVDFHKRTVRTLFVPPVGETVLWASRWYDDRSREELERAGVVTDKAVYVLGESGTRAFSAPWAYDCQRYLLRNVVLKEDPQRYRVWYVPRWYLERETLESLPGYVVEYDAAGREITRRTLPARPQLNGYFASPRLRPAEPSYRQVVFGLVTSPAEGAVLVGTTRQLFADLQSSQGAEMSLLLQFLIQTTTVFIPGAGWNMRVDEGMTYGFTALMLVSAAVCGLVCFLLARRHCFARARCFGWSLCGLLFGPTGLLLMLAIEEWPVRIPCHSCDKPRDVSRGPCEHCGAAHAPPASDGTEIFEQTAVNPQAALAGR